MIGFQLGIGVVYRESHRKMVHAIHIFRHLVGVIAMITLAVSASPANSNQAERLLRPPDTSSPAKTLESFIYNIDVAIQRYRSSGAFASSKRWQTSVLVAMNRAARCLDLGEVGQAFKHIRRREAALQIKEVLQRVELPPESEIPTVEDLEEANLSGWRIPNTEIVISRIGSGPRTGEFLFSAETVERAEDFYDRVRHLPYRSDKALPVFDIYIHAAGFWIDPDWIDSLPAWTKSVVIGQTIWQLIGAVALVIITIVAIVAAAKLGRAWNRRFRDRHVFWQIGGIAAAAIAIFATKFTDHVLTKQFKLIGELGIVTETSATLILIMLVGWLGWQLLGWVSDFIILAQGFANQSIDAHMIRVSTRLVSFVFIVGLIVYGAGTLGLPITPVLAGVGIGGAAIALAARPTLENVIGGFILFMDRPVRVGDFCRFGDKLGVVEEIGLRSTRIRTRGRTIITIPNADFSQMQLENFADRDQFLLHLTVHLTRNTSEQQLTDWLDRVRALIGEDDRVSDDFSRVRLVAFGDHSYQTEIFAYVLTNDYAEFLGAQESILFAITAITRDVGTELALPIQILARDKTTRKQEPAPTTV